MNERSLVQDLNDLHASFVSAINVAVADDDLELADRLAGRVRHRGRPDDRRA